MQQHLSQPRCCWQPTAPSTPKRFGAYSNRVFDEPVHGEDFTNFRLDQFGRFFFADGGVIEILNSQRTQARIWLGDLSHILVHHLQL